MFNGASTWCWAATRQNRRYLAHQPRSDLSAPFTFAHQALMAPLVCTAHCHGQLFRGGVERGHGDADFAQRLGLPLYPVVTVRVEAANGAKKQCRGRPSLSRAA